MPKLTMETVRAIVRPLLTLTGWFGLMFLALTIEGDIRRSFVDATMMMVAFWFGSRKEK